MLAECVAVDGDATTHPVDMNVHVRSRGQRCGDFMDGHALFVSKDFAHRHAVDGAVVPRLPATLGKKAPVATRAERRAQVPDCPSGSITLIRPTIELLTKHSPPIDEIAKAPSRAHTRRR